MNKLEEKRQLFKQQQFIESLQKDLGLIFSSGELSLYSNKSINPSEIWMNITKKEGRAIPYMLIKTSSSTTDDYLLHKVINFVKEHLEDCKNLLVNIDNPDKNGVCWFECDYNLFLEKHHSYFEFHSFSYCQLLLAVDSLKFVAFWDNHNQEIECYKGEYINGTPIFNSHT